MELKTLSNKRTLNGLVDLQDQTWSNQFKMDIIDVFEVTEEYVMRWDKIASKYYGDGDLGDGLYKFNEYSNPNSLDVGDLIYIPKKEHIKKGYVVDASPNIFELQPEIQPLQSPNSKVDPNRQSFLNNKKKLSVPTIENATKIQNNDNGTITLVKG